MDRRKGERASSPRTKEVIEERSQYLAGWRWRRAVEAELKPLSLTFTQWLVLEATESVLSESGDAVSQNAVAERVELDRMTVSQVMTTLAGRGLVDRGPSASGRAYRVILTAAGRRTIKQAALRVRVATERTRQA